MAVEFSNSGQAVPISALVTDDEGALAAAFLHYRAAGDSGFVAGAMEISSVDDTTFAVEGFLPGDIITDSGTEYFITAIDTHGVQSRLPSAGIISIRAQITGSGLTKTSPQPGGSAQTGYRLISMPLELDDQSPETVLGDDLGAYDAARWRLFQWVATPTGGVAKLEFPRTSAMAAGTAFWLIVKESGKTLDSGPGATVSTAEDYEVQVATGWNLIGNPFNFPTIVDSRLSDGSRFSLFSYDVNGWSTELDPETTLLMPFEGYAVSSPTNSSLLIKATPFAAQSVVSKQQATNKSDLFWSIRIRAQCQNARDNNNILAVAEEAMREWDPLDHPEPPAVGEYVSVSFAHPEWNRSNIHFSTDIRPFPLHGEEWEFEVKTYIRD
ncbi:MAG: hypothetical protein ACE1Y4_09225, partial [Lysobacterales bacterium]